MSLDIAGHHLLQVCSQESQEMDEAPKGTVLSISAICSTYSVIKWWLANLYTVVVLLDL
jgi:hypothetical protein